MECRELTSLDVRQNTALTSLNCYGNKLDWEGLENEIRLNK